MKMKIVILCASLCFLVPFSAFAGPFEDGEKAYKAGKYGDALKIWKQAAEQGDTKSGTHLGWMHAEGIRFRQSYEEAKKRYQKAADQGHSGAQFLLAQLYEKGNGMPQSDTQALVWYHKSAKQGHVYSLYALGTMYENGKGVDQSYTQALGWYRKAAQSGYDRAEYKLGGIYYYGRGTARSKSTAIDWYKKASASGSHKAAQVLERLKGTTEKHTGKDDTPIYVIPDDVAKSAAAIFDLVQEDGIFNEQNARDLMAIYLEVDKLSNNEKQTLLALSKSTNASVKYQSGTVANRTVQAQYIMNLIVRPENLNEFWFKGDDGMRHLVNMASVAPVVDSRVINFVGSKFWTEWQESSISNGYGPVRDVIAKMYTECEKLSPQQKRTCSQLAYKAMVRVQDHVKKPGSKRIPIFIYNWLERAPQD